MLPKYLKLTAGQVDGIVAGKLGRFAKLGRFVETEDLTWAAGSKKCPVSKQLECGSCPQSARSPRMSGSIQLVGVQRRARNPTALRRQPDVQEVLDQGRDFDDDWREHHADHGHELDQDIQRRAAGIFAGIAHRIADDARFVRI